MTDRPTGKLVLQTVPLPRDRNLNGDIFGGWILSQMDIAGGVAASRRAGGRVVTVGIEAMTFHRPVLTGDLVACYAEIVRVGRTSIAVRIEVWVERDRGGELMKVTEGIFTFVAIDDERRKRPIDPAPSAAS